MALCFFICALSTALQAQDTLPHIETATTFWPPYMDPDLPNKGFISEIVHTTFKKAGFEAGVVFAPWQRSQTAMLSSAKYNATFPVYDTQPRRQECHLSNVIGASTVGFVERRDNPVSWHNLEDLRGRQIGTVIGYSNTDQFDRLAAKGVLDVSTVPRDLLNLRRLIFKRIDLAVMDKYVLRYLLQNSAELKTTRKTLGLNKKIIQHQNLYVCFPRNHAGEKLRDSFNAAIDPSEIQQLMEKSLSSLGLDDKNWAHP